MNVGLQPIRILGRRYSLTKTAYKYLDIGININRPSYVTIVLGDCHGKEISLSPNMWKELLDLRQTILPYFKCNDDDETRAPSPIHIDHLTLRFSKINNLRILRLETPKIRLAISTDTVLGLFNLEYCVNRLVTSLNGIITNVDNKLTRFLEIAANVTDPASIPMAIRDSESFDRNDLIDCELQALLFGIAS